MIALVLIAIFGLQLGLWSAVGEAVKSTFYSDADSFTLQASNDPPTITQGETAELSCTEDDAAVTLTLTATDTDGDTLTWSVSPAQRGIAEVTAGVVRYTPNADENGTDQFTVTVEDGQGGSDTLTVQVAIAAVNDQPTFTAGANQTVQEDCGAVAVTPWASNISAGAADEADQALAFLVTGNTNTSLFTADGQPAVSTDGTLRYTPADNAHGSATVTLRLKEQADGGLSSAEKSFTITVTSVNDAPICQTQPVVSGLPRVGQTLTVDNGVWSDSADQPAGTLTYAIHWQSATDASGANLATVGDGATFVIVTGQRHLLIRAQVVVTDTDASGTATADTATQWMQVENQMPVLEQSTATLSMLEDGAETTVTLAATDPDEDTLHWSLSPAALGTASVLDGVVTYTPRADENGEDSFTVTVADEYGGEATCDVTVLIQAVNDPPSFTLGEDPIVEEDSQPQPYVGWVEEINRGAANESEQTLHFTVTENTNPTLFTVEGQPAVDAAGTLTFTLAPNQHGEAAVTLQLLDNGDGDNASAPQTFHITVTAVNDAPVNTEVPTLTGTLLVGQTLAGSSGVWADDADGNLQTPVFTYLWQTSEDMLGSGLVNQTEGSAYLVTPQDAHRYIRVLVTATDTDDSGIATATAASDWQQVLNTAPVLADASAAIGLAEDQTQTFTLAASDADSDTLLWSATAPLHGAATVTDGVVSYHPEADYHGADSFSVAVADGYGGTDDIPITVTVTPVNDTPTFTLGDPVTVAEDAPAQSIPQWIAASSTGPDDEADQTWAFLVTCDRGDLFAADGEPQLDPDGTLTFTPAPDANGMATVSVAMQDSGDGANTTEPQTFTLTITPVNDPPSFTVGENQTVAEDSVPAAVTDWVRDASAGPADEAEQTLTYYVTCDHPEWFAEGGQPAVTAEGTLTYRPAENAFGMATVTVTVSDNGGTANAGDADTSAAQTFTITITPVNDAPSFTAGGNLTVAEDAGPQTLTNWVAAKAAGPANENDQNLHFTVTGNTNPALFASDGAPVVLPDGTLTYTTAADANGTAEISLVISDNGGVANAGDVDTSAAQTFTITVTPVNDAPWVTGTDTVTTQEDTACEYPFTIGDAEDAASALTLTCDTTNTAMLKKANMTLSGTGANRTLTMLPETNRNGTVAITLTVTDRNNVSTTKTVTLNITAVNDAPTISPIANRITDEDTSTGAVGLTIGDVDSDVSLCTISAVSNNPALVPNNEGSIVPGGSGAARTLTLTPAKDQTGTAEITVTVSDGQKESQTTFTLTVTPVNDAPAITPIANQSINEDTDTGEIAFTVSDVDNQLTELTVSASTTNTAMIPRVNIVLSTIGDDGVCTLRVTTTANSYGTATMTVTVKDTAGKLGTATFVLTVNAVNDAPVLSAVDNLTTPEDTAKTVTLTVSDIDTSAGSLALSATDTTNPDLLPLNRITVTAPTDTTRNVLLNPLPNRYGTATITLTLTDGQGGEALRTFTVTVQSVNDAPAFTPGANLTVVEDCGAVTSEAWAKAITTGADNEVQSLAFTVTTDHDAMFAVLPTIHADTGDLTFTPAQDACGVVNVTAVLTDSDGATSGAAAFTISITAVNDAPVALNMDADMDTDEDQDLSGSLRAADVDGDTLTYELVSGTDHGVTALDTAHGHVTLNAATGTFVYHPNTDFYDGTDSFGFRVYDAALYSNDATVTITFTGVNDAPVAQDATITVAEDATDAVVDLSALVTDVDSPTLTYTLVTGPDVGGMLTPAGEAGHYDYLPIANYNGVERFTYRASDGELVSNTAIVTLVITPVNDAPVAVDETIGVDEGQTLYGVFKATDVEGDAISYAILDNPAPELLSLEDSTSGLFRYDAPVVPGTESRTLTLTYRATDANGATDDGTITILVRSVNLPPVRKSDATTQFSTQEDASLTGNLGVEDPNGDTLQFTVLNPPLHGAISGLDAEGNFTYTPNLNYHGGDRFTFTAVDPYGLHSGIYAVLLQITDVNDPPEAYDQIYETAFNTACSGIVLVGYDPDGDSLTYAFTQPANGTVTKEDNGTYTYLPTTDFAGTDTFTYTADDGRGGISASATVTVYVYGTGGDESGLHYLPNRQTPEDTPIDVTVTATGFTIDSVTAASSNQWLMAADGIVVNGPTITLTPRENRNGRTVITVHAVSGVTTYTRTFILTVTPVNDAPVPAVLARTIDEDTEMFEFVSASDSDGDALVFAAATQPSHGTLTFYADGAFHYVPANSFTGEDAFTYTVSDGQVTAGPQTVSITVTPIPMAPTAENASFTTDEDTPLTQTLTGEDDNGEAVQFILMQNPHMGTVALLADGSFTYTPYANRNGSDMFTFCTKNEDGRYSAVAKVTITVQPVNDLPNLVEKTLAAYEDTPVSGYLRGTDVDGDRLTYAIDPQEGDLQLGTLTLDSSTGYYRYQPNTNLHGTDTFHIVVSDPTASAPPVTFTVTIAPVNDPPAATDVAIATTEDTVVQASVTGFYTDPDGDTQTLSLVQSPAKGTVVFDAEGQYTYTPYANLNGVDYFTFRTRDPGGLSSNVALATVTIAPVNDAPVITAKPTMTIPEDSQNQIFEFTVGDVEDDASALTVSGTWDETKIASVTFWGTGASRWMKVTPVGNFIGETPIVVTVWDTGKDGTLVGEPKSADATVTVTVTEVNDTPTINGKATNGLPLTDAVTIDEDTSTDAIGYTVADEEQTAASLTVRAVSSNTTLLPVAGIQLGGTDADRWLKATPAPDRYGKVRITVYVNDGNTERSAYLDLTVNPVNDAPVVTAPADQTIPEDGATETLYYTVSDIDSAVTSILMSATSSDPSLVADAGIVLAGNGAERTVAVQPLSNANGDVTITLTANDQNTLNNLGYATFLVHVSAVDDAPTIDAINPYTMDEDTVSETIAVQVADIDDDPDTITLSAVSGNPALIDAAGIAFGRYDTSGARWVQLTPKANQYGCALITLKATDSTGKSSLRSFLLTVNPVNDPPEISEVEDQTIFEDSATGTITFTVGDIDNDVLELTVTGTSGDTSIVAPGGIAIAGNGAERTVKVMPLPNQNGDVAITLTVTDPKLLSASTTFVVHCNPVNDVPTFTAGANQQVLEDCGAQTVQAWATAINPGMANESAQAITFHVSNDHAALFTGEGQPALASDGTLTYTPVPDGNGVAQVTVYAKDDGGTDHGGVDTSVSKVFTITVLPVNDQPTFAAEEEVTFSEDSGAHTVPYITAGSIDPGPVENETQTYTFLIDQVITDSVAGNTALFSAGPTVNAATGAISFTPNTNANGVARVMVALRDADGTENGGLDTSVLHTFTIRITAVNDPPLFALPASVTVNEDSGAYSKACATGISAGGGTDETAQTLTFTLSGYNAALFATAPSMTSQGVLSFTPATDAFGSTTVTVVLSDGASTVTHSMQIIILALNDAPSFTPGANQSTLEDAGTQTAIAWAQNLSIGPDNEKPQTLTFHTANDQPGLFATAGQPTLQSNGTLTYTPVENAFGTANVTVYLTDSGASTGGNKNQSASAVFQITVTPVNDQPTFLPGEDQQTLEDSGAQTVIGWASGMYAGAANEAGQTFAFTADNDQPALFRADGQPAISPEGTLTYTPADDAFGNATVTVALRDNGGTEHGGVDTAAAVTFVIIVLPVNDQPTFADAGDITVMEDEGTYSEPWAVPDSVFVGPGNESQTHTFAIASVTPLRLAGNTALFAQAPAIDPVTGAIRFTPMENANGAVEVTVTLRDPDGVENGGMDTSVAHRLTITVLAVDDPPMFETHGTVTVLEDSGTYSGAYATGVQPGGGTDEADQTLAFTLASNHPEMFAQAPAMTNAGQLTFTPAADVFGDALITAELSDGRSVLQKTFMVTITPVNDQPAFEDTGDITVEEDAGVTRVPLVKTDTLTLGPDNEKQTPTFHLLQTQVQAVAGNTALFSEQPQLDAETGTVQFTPMSNASGSAEITFTLQDNGGVANGGVDTSVAHTLTLTVTPVNDPPTFTLGSGITVNEDGPAYDAPFASAITPGGGSDEADQSVSFALGGYDAGLFAAVPSINAKGRLSFQPAPDAYGTTTVTVGLNDGTNTTLATFPITLRPVNDPPTFTAGEDQQVLQNAPAQVIPGWASAISKGPANENAQTVAFQVSNNNKTLFTANGQPAVSSTGQLTYTPAPGAYGQAKVSVTLADNGGTALGGKNASDTKTFTITVLADTNQPFTTLTVTKVWTDESDAEKLRPKSVTVYVYNEDGIVSSQKLSAANGWKTRFDNLPAYSETGVPIRYQVVESPVEQYHTHYQYSALMATVENIHMIDPFEQVETPTLLVVEEYSMPLGANNNLNEGDCFN